MMKRIAASSGLLALLFVAAVHGQTANGSATAAPQQQQQQQQPPVRKSQNARRAMATPRQLPPINSTTGSRDGQARNSRSTHDNNNSQAAISRNVTAIPRVKPKPLERQAIIDSRARYNEALRHCHRERHDHHWWRQRYVYIVLVGSGYYYWDAGYWFPAYGYDPNYDSYDYDGPIYTYGNLLPDQVIINVQGALRDLGYYNGNLTGSLGPTTRHAISAFQNDYGLDVTGTVDEATVAALGLID